LDSNASYFDLRKYNYKVSFTINTHFPPLRHTLNASRDELFAEVPGLFTHAVVHLVIRNRASTQGFLQEAKKM
jgi:hypothetical protein